MSYDGSSPRLEAKEESTAATSYSGQNTRIKTSVNCALGTVSFVQSWRLVAGRASSWQHPSMTGGRLLYLPSEEQGWKRTKNTFCPVSAFNVHLSESNMGFGKDRLILI